MKLAHLMASLSLEQQRSDTASQTTTSATKKRKRAKYDEGSKAVVSSRRRTACQSCRARKVKCDNVRPRCAFCRSSGTDCIYVDNMADRLALDPGTKLMVARLDQILKSVDASSALVQDGRQSDGRPRGFPIPPGTDKTSISNHPLEPSKDYLRIPACRTTADTVLTWPVFNDNYTADCLIGGIFSPPVDPSQLGLSEEHCSKFSKIGRGLSSDVFTASGGLHTLSEEKIPSLIERFLQNVHTKNPILDVEALLRYGRSAAEHGLRWDAPSCLVLLACALGSVAYPFTVSLASSPTIERNFELGTIPHGCEMSSAALYAAELQQAESYFVLACCRIGLLKPTVLGAQCHFFAGGELAFVSPHPSGRFLMERCSDTTCLVYLMYTLRPVASWEHFSQASNFYLLYLKTISGPIHDDSSNQGVQYSTEMDPTQQRLEQSLYWSCFKSEIEFRVELPLPQSPMADLERTDMFPSPPLPAPTRYVSRTTSPASLHRFVNINYDVGVEDIRGHDRRMSLNPDEWAIRQHTRELYNEEESWYYYLTEIALRRIGNRIINTFHQHPDEHKSWVDIAPLIPIAQELEAQISTWSANLPPSMMHHESHVDGFADGHSSASKELTWATENRIIEMKSWLYQPFLYYAIHQGGPVRRLQGNTSPGPSLYEMFEASLLKPASNGNPMYQAMESKIVSSHLNEAPPTPLLDPESAELQALIKTGIECNLKIVEGRSLRHRHHGLWYDLRALVTACLILLALVRTANLDPKEVGESSLAELDKHGSKFTRAIEALRFWEDEAPDIRHAREILQDLLHKTREMLHGAF